MSLPDKLAANRYLTDEGQSHIAIDQAKAKAAGLGPRLVAVCPAGVYSLDGEGTVGIEFAACFECGACLAVDDSGALTWNYPRGGMGISFRSG